MELANLLESGDKGTGLSNKAAREVAATGEIESLPKQEGRELVEEVFEYLEIDASTVKRRWWASESYDTYRENIISTKDDGERWKWMDGDWVSSDKRPLLFYFLILYLMPSCTRVVICRQ